MKAWFAPNLRPFLLQLALSALLSLLSWNFGLPFLKVHRYVEGIGLYFGPIPNLFCLLLSCLCLNYFWILYRVDVRQVSNKHLNSLILISCLINFCSLTLTSADFYSYIQFARIFAVYGKSPYLVTYENIQDIYSTFTWFKGTSNYGPLTFVAAAPAALASEISPYLGFLVLKCTFLLMVVFALRWLKLLLGESPQWLIYLIANPLWILEIGINCHNDIIGFFLIVGMLRAFSMKNNRTAGFYSSLLPFFKLPLGVLPAFLVLRFVVKRNWKMVLVTSSYIVAFLGVMMSLHSDQVSAFRFLSGNSTMALDSFFGRLMWFYKNIFGADVIFYAMGYVFPYVALVLVLALVAWMGLSRRATGDFRRMEILLTLMVFFCATQYYPWYGLWILPFLIVLQNKEELALFSIVVFSTFIMYTSQYTPLLTANELADLSSFELLYFLAPVLSTLISVYWVLKRTSESKLAAPQQTFSL